MVDSETYRTLVTIFPFVSFMSTVKYEKYLVQGNNIRVNRFFNIARSWFLLKWGTEWRSPHLYTHTHKKKIFNRSSILQMGNFCSQILSKNTEILRCNQLLQQSSFDNLGTIRCLLKIFYKYHFDSFHIRHLSIGENKLEIT